ncbi:MAG: hypothetical protein VB835_05445, partial [Pirellulales bacterium]
MVRIHDGVLSDQDIADNYAFQAAEFGGGGGGGGGGAPVEPEADYVIGYSGETGHDRSLGVFEVEAGDILALDAFYYQGGGGHSGEISLAQGKHTSFNTNDFTLLEDGVHGVKLGTAAGPSRSAIASFEVAETTEYLVKNSSVTALGAGDVEVKLVVQGSETTEVISLNLASGETKTFDTSLGELSKGSQIQVIVSPGDDDTGDVVDLDYSIVQVSAKVPVGWEYSWNAPAPPAPGGVADELAVWIDASDINGNFVVDSVENSIQNGAVVNNWVDKSGNGHNFNRVRRGDPNYVANSIADGKPTVNFDGDDILQIDPAGQHNPRNFINANGEFTLITVARYTGGDSERVIATSTGHNWLAGFHGNGFGRWHYDGWGSLDVGGHNRDENFHIHSNQMNVNGVANNPAGDFYRDGQLLTNDGTGTGDGRNNNVPDGLSLGGWNDNSEVSRSEVSELIMYDRVISDDELLAVREYLADKYDITVADDVGGNEGGGGGADDEFTIGFSGGTGHNQSLGVFEVNAGDILKLDALYYQGGGGHSGEISLAQGTQANFNNNFQLLRDGVHGVQFGTGAEAVTGTLNALSVQLNTTNGNSSNTISAEFSPAAAVVDVATLNGTAGTLNVTNPANRLTSVSRFEVGDDAKLIGTIGEESSALGSADLVLDGGTLSFAVEDDGGGGGASLPVVDKLEGWWDATDLSTLFQDTAGTIPVTQAGDLVGLWTDKSPDVTTIANKAPWNFWQENDGERPAWHDTSMGGAPTLHLNDGPSGGCCNDGMKVHNAGGNPNFMPNDSIRENSTVIVVDRYWGGTRGRTVMSGTGNNWLMNKWNGQNAMHGDGGWVSNPGTANGAIPLDVPFIGVWTRGGGQAHFYGSGPNGVFDRDFTNNAGIGGTPGTLAIGIEGNCCGGEQSQADIAEIIVYDKVLTAAERQAVQAYLVDKYADGTPAVPGTGGGGGGATLDNTVVVTGDGTIDLGDMGGASLSGLDMHVGSNLTIDSNEPESKVTFRDNI